MSKHLILIERPADWPSDLPPLPRMTAKDFIDANDETDLAADRQLRVINLCRGYRYGSMGYYCSLLAEARGQRILPSVGTALDLSRKTIYEPLTEDLDEDLQKYLRGHDAREIRLWIFLGRASNPAFQDLADDLFERLPCPLLAVDLHQDNRWQIHRVRPIGLSELDRDQRQLFAEALQHYLAGVWQNPRRRSPGRYDLAILHDPTDALPPSNPRALKAFIRAGKRLGLDVELITRKDYGRLAEYDALFIRETTAINHHSFRFAKRAEAEGLVVIDDPISILRCTNKVYLAELLRTHRIRTPATQILRRERTLELEPPLDYPVVLKIPDGAFSVGVTKVHDAAELKDVAERMFQKSDLILAQEYLYTEYDWRIGVLNRQPLYACQYFMSKDHWQIYQHKAGGGVVEGAARTLPLERVPPAVIKTAVKAARLIGTGLYGVDLKQTRQGVCVIEINDNPNIDAGVEDQILKEQLYEEIMAEFLRRLDQRTRLRYRGG
jgi:glutathione synthase/RimK-type ligase-like ATP-grasp enzyme